MQVDGLSSMGVQQAGISIRGLEWAHRPTTGILEAFTS